MAEYTAMVPTGPDSIRWLRFKKEPDLFLRCSPLEEKNLGSEAAQVLLDFSKLPMRQQYKERWRGLLPEDPMSKSGRYELVAPVQHNGPLPDGDDESFGQAEWLTQINAFIAKYGPIGSGYGSGEYDDRGRLIESRERASDWRRVQTDLKGAVNLWSALKSDDKNYLRKHLSVEALSTGDKAAIIHYVLGSTSDTTVVYADSACSTVNLRQAASEVLMDIANRKLESATQLQLNSTPSHPSDFKLKLHVRSLSNFLWWTLAESISGGVAGVQCNCGTVFFPKRRNQKSCTPGCRVKKHRAENSS